jgi:hypothetical protein
VHCYLPILVLCLEKSQSLVPYKGQRQKKDYERKLLKEKITDSSLSRISLTAWNSCRFSTSTVDDMIILLLKRCFRVTAADVVVSSMRGEGGSSSSSSMQRVEIRILLLDCLRRSRSKYVASLW